MSLLRTSIIAVCVLSSSLAVGSVRRAFAHCEQVWHEPANSAQQTCRDVQPLLALESGEVMCELRMNCLNRNGRKVPNTVSFPLHKRRIHRWNCNGNVGRSRC